MLNLNLIPKWTTLIFTTLVLCMLLLSTTSFAETYRWGTNWGNMVVSTNDGHVFTGTYDGGPNGRLWGKYNESSRKFVGLWYQSKSDKNADLQEKGHGIGERSSINLIQMKQVFMELGDIVAISLPTSGRASFSKLSIIRTFEAFVLACNERG